jgi:UDP-4-amino-4,6-dideoxy-N-acetyl-beta-L-altrosamine N-acetyltransferase
MNASSMQRAPIQVRLLPLARASAAQIEELRQLRNRPEIRAQLFHSHDIGAAEHAKWADSMRDNPRARIYLTLVGDAVAGSAGITGIDAPNGHAEWGFYVAPEFQRRGVARAMLAQLIDSFFADSHMQKLHAGVLEGNDASILLHRRFGFADEGMRPRYKRDGDGRYRACLLFGLMRETWAARRAEISGGERK